MKINLKEYIGLLKKYLRKETGGLVLLFAILIINVLVETAKPKILGSFMDQVMGKGPLSQLYQLAVIFLLLTLAKQGIAVLIAWLTQNIGWRATNSLRMDLTRHALNLDMGFHKRFTPGQLVERVDGDINSLFGFFTTFITGITMNAFLLVGILTYFFFIHWGFALLYVLAALLIYFYGRVLSQPIDKNSEALRQAESDLYGITGEMITSVEDIRTLNARVHSTNRVKTVMKPLKKLFIRDWVLGFSLWSWTELVFWSIEFLIIILMAYQVLTGRMTIGMAYLVHRLGELVVGPIVDLREELLYMQKTEASVRRIRELLDQSRQVSQGTQTSNGNASIELKNVSFGYEADEKVIDDVSLKLEPGKILGLLGRTGSGKTTLARLMVKLYEPDQGAVSLGQTDLRDLSDETLRNRISYVTQEVELFNATVRDNLTLFDENIPDDYILKIIDDIGIREWFDKLPQGLDTKLSTEAPFLSTGELQLLAFIRVFLKDPDVVILDEATSRLDPVTEKYLEKALNHLLQDRTAIIIAHRLRTVLRADNIAILQDGRLMEAGPTKDLSQDPNSEFAKLLSRGLEEVLV